MGGNPRTATVQEKSEEEAIPTKPTGASDISDSGLARDDDGGSGGPSVKQKQPAPTTEMLVPAH